MRSVVNGNVVMRRIHVKFHETISECSGYAEQPAT